MEIYELSVNEIAENISNNKLSIIDVSSSFIDRVNALEKEIKAWEYIDLDHWKQQALEIEKIYSKVGEDGKPLTGIPFGIKDVFNTKDMPTCMGSKIWDGFTPGNDARIVEKIRWEGGIVAGKTVTAEFAVNHPGKTVNPFNSERITGTSSSGSAAAVATRMVPLSLGTQTAGSTIRPASYMGVYGYKPSFGLIPRTGILKTLDTLDHVTIFSNYVDDLKTCINLLRVTGENHPFVHEKMDNKPSTPDRSKQWKVAFIKTGTWDDAHKYTQEEIQNLANKLDQSQDVIVEEIELPSAISDVHRLHDKVYSKALSYYFKEECEEHPDIVSDEFKSLVERGKKVDFNEYKNSLHEQEKMINEMDKLFEHYDIVLSHSTAGEAPLIESAEEPDDPSLIWTFCHTPSLNIPMFKGPNNMPFGAQITARQYDDLNLLEFASLIKERFANE